MTSELPPHDFLKSTDFKNNEFLNTLLDFINSYAKVFNLDIDKLAISKIPFINGTDDPNTITVTNPTLIGYNNDLWLAVPSIKGTTVAYNMTSILKSGVIGNINNVFADPASGRFTLSKKGDIGINDLANIHSVEIDSSVIDAKVLENTRLANKGIADAHDASIEAITAKNTANNALISADNANTKADTNASDIAANKVDIGLLQAKSNANESSINKLKTDVADNKLDITALKSDVATSKSDIGTLKTDVGTLKTDVSTLQTSTAQDIDTITSSDSSIAVVKTGKSVDLKAVGGGSVKSVGGKSPDASGDIAIEPDETIDETASADANHLRFKVKVSADAQNALSVKSDGLYVTGQGQITNVGIRTINSNAAVNNNYKLTAKDASLTIDNSQTGTTSIGIKLDPAADNSLTKTANGLKAVGTNVVAKDKSIDIDNSQAGTSKVSVKIDPASDNAISLTTDGIKVVKGQGGHTHGEPNTVYYDDTYMNGGDDGSFEKPYRRLTDAIRKASEETIATSLHHTVKSRDTASYVIGRGGTYILGVLNRYVGISFNFPGKRFEGILQIDFNGKTSDLLNIIEVRCYDFAGAFDILNEGTVASIADQEDGINIYLDCQFKSTRTDKMQFGMDTTGITGISKKKYIQYTELVSNAMIEGQHIGTTSNINCILYDTFTNFEFIVNTTIRSVDSSQVTASNINKVFYISTLYVGTNHPTLKTSVSVTCVEPAATYKFAQYKADRSAYFTDEVVTISDLKAQHVDVNTLSSGAAEFKGQVILSNTVIPSTEGGMSYDSFDNALLLRTSKGIFKISQLSSEEKIKLIYVAKRVTMEDLIETIYQKKSIELPRMYITVFDENTDIPTSYIEMDRASIGIRRKDIIIPGGDPTDTITYPKNDSIDVHDFTTNPVYHGLAFFKMAAVTGVTIVDSADTEKVLETITFALPSTITEAMFKQAFKEGFTYTLQQGTGGRPYSFILYSIDSYDDSTKQVVLKGFSNIIATTNITNTLHKPYATLAEVQAEQGNFDSVYFGDQIDFAFNKTFLKGKARDSLFPQYFPLILNDKNNVNKQAIVLVGFNSRMKINPSIDEDAKRIGDKAISNELIPEIILQTFAAKWGTTEDKILFQLIGLPLYAGIVDNAKDKDINECREFLPMKIYTSDNNFEIKIFAGNGVFPTSKFKQDAIFGDAKTKWTAVNQNDVLAGSEYFVSTFVQDCAYINQVDVASIPMKSLTSDYRAGFTQATATLLKGVSKTSLDVYLESKELITEHYREGMYGLSTDISTAAPISQVKYMWSTAAEDITMYCRTVRGVFLSPFEVQFVDVVKETKQKPFSLTDKYAILEDDASATFNKIIYV